MTTSTGLHSAAAASLEERAAIGKAARRRVHRSSHAEWEPATRRPDPIDSLERQATTRVPELVPIRHGRMAASPFAFFRGAAAVMADDLARTPTSGFAVQLCGDAHLANFGGFASPDRDLVFDVNDFDETLPGPWEWDVKRLGASLEVAGRDREFDKAERHSAVLATVGAYREAIRELAHMGHLDLWYMRMDAADILERWAAELSTNAVRGFEHLVAKAEAKTRMRALSKLTHRVEGGLRIKNEPPLIVPVEELFADDTAERPNERMHELLRSYRASLPDDRRHLLERYEYVHAARKVVGVGSVGTRCWILLLVGRDEGDPLFLQVKEAEASVLEPFTSPCVYSHQGQRVVEGQRLTQAASDIFLGWLKFAGIDGVEREFYVRQLWDEKASLPVERMTPEVMRAYGEICGQTLARAHARSGDGVAIGAYLGAGETFDRAIADFSSAYADANARDHRELDAAIKAGRLPAEVGL